MEALWHNTLQQCTKLSQCQQMVTNSQWQCRGLYVAHGRTRNSKTSLSISRRSGVWYYMR